MDTSTGGGPAPEEPVAGADEPTPPAAPAVQPTIGETVLKLQDQSKWGFGVMLLEYPAPHEALTGYYLVRFAPSLDPNHSLWRGVAKFSGNDAVAAFCQAVQKMMQGLTGQTDPEREMQPSRIILPH